MATTPKSTRQLAWVFDLNKCIGCQTCSVACKVLWTQEDPGVDHAQLLATGGSADEVTRAVRDRERPEAGICGLAQLQATVSHHHGAGIDPENPHHRHGRQLYAPRP